MERICLFRFYGCVMKCCCEPIHFDSLILFVYTYDAYQRVCRHRRRRRRIQNMLLRLCSSSSSVDAKKKWNSFDFDIFSKTNQNNHTHFNASHT